MNFGPQRMLLSGAFVLVPQITKLKDKQLLYLDMLTYASIRWHDNNDNNCYPSYEIIAERSGLSRTFVIESIVRLEAAQLVRVERSTRKHKVNHYYFDMPGFKNANDLIPKAIVEDQLLSTNQKAMLICLRQFFYCGLLHSCNDIKTFADRLGLTYASVSAQIKPLIALGYVIEWKTKVKGDKKVRKSYYLSAVFVDNVDQPNCEVLSLWTPKLKVG